MTIENRKLDGQITTKVLAVVGVFAVQDAAADRERRGNDAGS